MFLSGGSFAVEFFFIVSGYLLMASIRRISTAPNALGSETRNFIIRKYKSFCPEIFVAYAVALIFHTVVNGENLGELFIRSFFEGTMLRMTGLHIMTINSAVWYISSMLLCMAIIYPLIRKYPDMSTKCLLPISALLLLGYFCGNGRSPRAPTEWMGWTYRGNLRAFAELSIGVCCFEVCDHLKKVDFTLAGKWMLAIVEYVCYFMIMHYMYFHNASRLDYFYIILYAIAITISFSEKAVDAGIFNNRACFYLGKYSFSIYLSHDFYSRNINLILPEEFDNASRMLLYLLCSVITGGIVMFASNVIRLKWKMVFNKFQKLIVR